MRRAAANSFVRITLEQGPVLAALDILVRICGLHLIRNFHAMERMWRRREKLR